MGAEYTAPPYIKKIPTKEPKTMPAKRATKPKTRKPRSPQAMKLRERFDRQERLIEDQQALIRLLVEKLDDLDNKVEDVVTQLANRGFYL